MRKAHPQNLLARADELIGLDANRHSIQFGARNCATDRSASQPRMTTGVRAHAFSIAIQRRFSPNIARLWEWKMCETRRQNIENLSRFPSKDAQHKDSDQTPDLSHLFVVSAGTAAVSSCLPSIRNECARTTT